jgi:acetyl-CoA synthetase
VSTQVDQGYGSGLPSDPDQIWARIESGLSTDPRKGLNTAVEACGRYAGQSGRLALVVREPDGSAQRWTYEELDRLAARTARVFATAGLRRGDRVAAVLTRQVESLVVALAAWRSGLVYVPLYCGFGSDAMAHRIEVSRAALVVADGRFREPLAQAQSQLSTDVHVLIVGATHAGDRSFWSEVEQAAPDGPQADTSATDLATLMFTSGTTGAPKACIMPHGGLVSLLPFAIHALAADSNSMLFTTADPGWSYGLYTTGVVPMSLGVPRVIYTGDFDPAAWRRVMVDEHVTHLAAAPSAYRRLAAEFATAGMPADLVIAAAAGEPLPSAVAQAWQAAGGPPIHDGYGMSEVGMLLGDLSNPESGTQAGSLAGPIPGFELSLIDESGDTVETGQPGRITVHSPRYQLSIGYENVPDQWTARWRGEQFVTDDLAQVAPDGRWQFVGRADDMIITSGFNVSPVEVESVLLQQPGVAEAAVVAAQDPARGTVVRAVVVRAENAPDPEAQRAQLRAVVTERVARYAAPRVIDFVDSLPRTEVGKIRRAALRTPKE